VIGTLAAIGVLLGGIFFAGGNPLGFIDIAAGIIIGGGVFCVLLISFSMDECLRLPSVIKIVFSYKKPNLQAIIDEIVEISNNVRHDGILSYDSKIDDLDDRFLALGLRMAVDGMQPDVVTAVLEREMDSIGNRHSVGADMMATLGKVAPVFGLIATLLGLILMLAHMNPDTIGQHMSVALMGTLYGISSANLFFLPYAAKLRYFHKQEVIAMEMKMNGILSMMNGEHPRITRLKLTTFLPERLHPAEKE